MSRLSTLPTQPPADGDADVPELARPGPSLARRLGSMVSWLLPVALLASSLVKWAQLLAEGPDKLVVQSDFVSTLTGARVIAEGHGSQLYDLGTQLLAQKAIRMPYMGDEGNALLPFNHLPFEALVVAPISAAPHWLLYALWDLLMAGAMLWSLLLLRSTLAPSQTSVARGPSPALVLTLAVISYTPVFRSFLLGQNSPLVLLGLCGAYVACRRNRPALAGAWLLLVALKPQVLPVALVAVLATGSWVAVAWFAGLMSAACLAIMPVLGIDWPLRYLSLLSGVANWSESGAIDPTIMHNWRGFAITLLGWLAPWAATALYVALSAASVALLVWAWRRLRSLLRLPDDQPHTHAHDWLWALAVVSAVLLSPHLNPHDLTLLVLPGWIVACLAAARLVRAIRPAWWQTLLWGDYVLLAIGFTLIDLRLTAPLSVVVLALACIWLAQEIARLPGAARQMIGH